MPKRPTPIPLSKAAARRIWLAAQRLDRAAPFGEGAAATPVAVQHLGYVQIDTINVVERCHHQILYTRIPSYRREHLAQAQSVDKSVFEYWTHALAYVPTADIRFFTRAMKREADNHSRFFATVKRGELQKVLGRIKRNGPLTIRDIDDDELREKDHEWASRKPSKRALQLAFYRGVLTVSRREGMLKTYELTTRHFGFERLPKPAPESERMAYLLDRALRAQGVVSLDSICHLNAPSKAAIARIIASRVRRGGLVPVALEGGGKQEHWATPEALDTVHDPAGGIVHILNPFDPLVIQRKRLALFFGYEHRFEAYVPKDKRVFGYFSQPVLIGDEIAAVLDLKTDRARGRLLIQKWTWLAQGPRRELRRRIEEELHRFERFQLDR
jgi:uncharacterized protein YcaQ